MRGISKSVTTTSGGSFCILAQPITASGAVMTLIRESVLKMACIT
jgi:hypothetical protein